MSRNLWFQTREIRRVSTSICHSCSIEASHYGAELQHLFPSRGSPGMFSCWRFSDIVCFSFGAFLSADAPGILYLQSFAECPTYSHIWQTSLVLYLIRFFRWDLAASELGLACELVFPAASSLCPISAFVNVIEQNWQFASIYCIACGLSLSAFLVFGLAWLSWTCASWLEGCLCWLPGCWAYWHHLWTNVSIISILALCLPAIACLFCNWFGSFANSQNCSIADASPP